MGKEQTAFEHVRDIDVIQAIPKNLPELHTCGAARVYHLPRRPAPEIHHDFDSLELLR